MPLAGRLPSKQCDPGCALSDSLPLRFGDDPARGFNKRKMKADRKAKADAAAPRASDAQVLEDAERLIAAWNERQGPRMPCLCSRQRSVPRWPGSEKFVPDARSRCLKTVKEPVAEPEFIHHTSPDGLPLATDCPYAGSGSHRFSHAATAVPNPMGGLPCP